MEIKRYKSTIRIRIRIAETLESQVNFMNNLNILSSFKLLTEVFKVVNLCTLFSSQEFICYSNIKKELQ